MSADSVDVVIVGAGVAGLSAAWDLRDRDVMVLEAAERIGGRVRVDERHGARYHLGAQYLAGATSMRLFEQLGVQRVALPKADGLFLRGHLRSGSAASLMRGLRTGPGALAEIAGVERESVRVSELVRPLVDPQASVADGAPGHGVALDARSFSDFLADRRPAVRSFYGTLIRSLTCKAPNDLSALYALAMLGSESVDGIGGASRARGGMGEILDAYTHALGSRVRTGARAVSVEQSDNEVCVRYHCGSGQREVRARSCVIAVPAPEVLRICPMLPQPRQDALRSVRYGRFLSVALFLREPVWQRGWGIACDLPVVSTLLNPAVLTGSGTGTVLSAYASDDGANQVWDLPDRAVIERFIMEISKVFPTVPGLVRDADLRRWEPGYPAWEPGHLNLLPQLAAPAGRLVFCGDYLSIPSIDGAIVSALRAAQVVRQLR
jgi:protoporphyrinogen/coproporphyrinogen III oxidase